MKRKVIVLALMCVCIAVLCSCSRNADNPSTYRDYFDLGVRYLSEGNYEEAVIAFTAAIEIDPKQAEAYEKLADAYLALGDTDAALRALRNGYAVTENARLQARINELTESESTPMPEPTSALAPVDDIEFVSEYTNESMIYAIITAYSSTGEVVWSYKTPEYEATQLDRVSEIGCKDDRYYFVQDSSIVAMDVQTGNIIWQNGDFVGAGTASAFGKDAIYLCGELGPDFYAISYDGKTLSRIERLNEKYYWASEIELVGEQAAVYLHGGTQDYDTPKVYYVNLNNYEISDNLSPTEGTQAEKESYSSYQDILDIFYRGISNHWADYDYYHSDVSSELGISYMWYMHPDISLSNAGYALMDLDGNGVLELLVSRISESWGAKEGMIYDLYTLQGGKVIHLASSGERDRYYLCENYLIANEGSGGAGYSEYSFYTVTHNKDSLVLKEKIVYDGWEDDERPWFYGTTKVATKNELVSIGENDAWQIINSYEHLPFELVLFDSYTPGQST